MTWMHYLYQSRQPTHTMAVPPAGRHETHGALLTLIYFAIFTASKQTGKCCHLFRQLEKVGVTGW